MVGVKKNKSDVALWIVDVANRDNPGGGIGNQTKGVAS